jgi:hypothetical protein
MSLRGTFKTNKEAEVNGVDIPVEVNEHNGEPIFINISRMGTANKKYTKRLEAVMEPHQASLNNDSMNNELAGKLLREVFADTVLNGWTNLPRSELTGNPEHSDLLEFNRENVLALFDAMPEVYDDWSGRAKKSASFRDKVRHEIAKN